MKFVNVLVLHLPKSDVAAAAVEACYLKQKRPPRPHTVRKCFRTKAAAAADWKRCCLATVDAALS